MRRYISTQGETYGRRLGRDIICDSVDTLNLVGDTRGDATEDLRREEIPTGQQLETYISQITLHAKLRKTETK